MPKKQVIARVCLAAAVSVALMVFAWWRTGLHFETNDDVYITSLLSGVITGEPDAHVIYVNYLLSLPLSLLYRITVEVPWYGGMLVLFMALCLGVMLDSAYSGCGGRLSFMIVTAALAGIFAAYYYCMGLVQYTAVAAFLAISGYVGFLLRKDRRTALVWFFVLELLAFLLRREAMLMIQPLGGTAVLAAMPEKLRQPEGRKEFLKAAASLALILCIGGVGNLAGYYGEEWDRYWQFNDTRTLQFDYYGVLEYEEIRPILEEYGVSREKYDAYRSYMILDWKMDGAMEERMKDYMEGHQEKLPQIGRLLQGTFRASGVDIPWRIRYVTILTWGVFGLWMLLNRKWVRFLAGGLLMLGARTAVWGYLVWRGRLPLRVTLPLLACEVILLLVLIWRDAREAAPAVWKRLLMLVGCGGWGLICLIAAREQLRYVESLAENQLIMMQTLREIREYCDSRPENRYLLDAHSMTYFRGSVFETEVYRPTNAVYSGGWFSTAPGVQKRLEEYLGTASGFYFLVLDNGAQEDPRGFWYLIQEMGQEPKLADQWTAAHGGIYSVYYFQGPFPFS